MNQSDFKLLSETQQRESLWQCGFIIGTRNDNKYAYVLYSLDDFFIEIKYEEATVVSIETFKNNKSLKLYPSVYPVKKEYCLTRSRLKNS